MPKAPPYPNKPPQYTEMPQETVAKQHQPGLARELAHKSMMLKDVRHNAADGGKASSLTGRGKRII